MEALERRVFLPANRFGTCAGMTALEKEEGQRVRVVRVFVSSPGDVEHERRRVDRVAERLNGEFAGIARIETIRWQNSFYGAPADFQGRIPEAADCDVVIAIFWSRLGPELPPDFPRMPDGEPYPSATAYEVLTAIAARESKDAPDVFVFRKNEPPRAAIDDDAELEHAQTQWKHLRTFFERRIHNPQGHTVASVRRFESVDQFEAQVDALLRDWLETHVPHGRSMIWPIAIKGSPFRGLACFDVEHAPVFFGRARDVARAYRPAQGCVRAQVPVPARRRSKRRRQIIAGARRARSAAHRPGCCGGG